MLLLAACPSEPKSPAPEDLIERVEVAGCRETRRGPVCEIEDNVEVVLWVAAAPESELSVRGVDASWEEIDGGWQTAFEVTTATRAIEVVAKRTGKDRYTLPVVVWKRPPRLVEADKLRTKSATTALAILDSLEPTADLRTQADIATMRARIAFGRGDYDKAVELRRKSAAAGDAAGLVSRPIYDFGTIAYIATSMTRDVDLARSALDEMQRRLPNSIAGERAYAAYYEASLSRETGDFRSAIAYAKDSERYADRLRDPWSSAAGERLAHVLALMGLHEQVATQFERLARADSMETNACARASFVGNRAWTTVMGREAGFAGAHDPAKDAADALRIISETCRWPEQEVNVLATLAMTELQEGHLAAAREHIEHAKRLTVKPEYDVVLWLIDIEARLELASANHAGALTAYRKLQRLGERGGSSIGEWRAAVGRARVLATVGSYAEAKAAYEHAEQLLNEALLIPFGGAEGAMLVDAQDAVAAQHAGLLLSLGKVDEALNRLARSARYRRRGIERGFRLAGLRGEQRIRWNRAAMQYLNLRTKLDALDGDDWGGSTSKQRSKDRQRKRITREISNALLEALRVLGPDSKTPVVGPRLPPNQIRLTVDKTDTGWIAAAETTSTTQVVRLKNLNPQAPDATLSQVVLGPFAELLERHQSIVVAARGAAQGIDFHRLPWLGRPLIISHTVSYTTDAAATSEANAGMGSVALVVADPSGNLPSARDEARKVQARLQEADVGVRSITGNQTTRNRLVELVQGADLLHWSGHGRDDPEIGFSAELPLAGTASLDVGDILALPHVPRRVVLSGCATAPPRTREVGPARAFVLAGAREVVATTRPVRDADAAVITAALYDYPNISLTRALHQVQKSLALADSDIDWAAFRVLVP